MPLKFYVCVFLCFFFGQMPYLPFRLFPEQSLVYKFEDALLLMDLINNNIINTKNIVKRFDFCSNLLTVREPCYLRMTT